MQSDVETAALVVMEWTTDSHEQHGAEVEYRIVRKKKTYWGDQNEFILEMSDGEDSLGNVRWVQAWGDATRISRHLIDQLGSIGLRQKLAELHT